MIICDNLGSSNTVVGSAAQEDYLPHLPLTHYLSNPTLSHHPRQLYRLSRNSASNWQWQLDIEWPIGRKKLAAKRLKHCQRHNGPKALTFITKQKVHQALKSWSNLSFVLFGKGRGIHGTNPCNNYNKPM